MAVLDWVLRECEFVYCVLKKLWVQYNNRVGADAAEKRHSPVKTIESLSQRVAQLGVENEVDQRNGA